MSLEYTYKLIRSDRKTIAISINSYNEIEVRAPKRYPINALNELVSGKSDWIEKTMTERLSSDISDIINYKKLLFNGDKFDYIFTKDVNRITMHDKSLQLPIKYIDTCQDIETLRYQADAKNVLAQWYCGQASDYINSVIIRLSNEMKVNYIKVVLSNSGNYFGSCSMKKTISLNWRISMLPDDVKRYLIVHELAHLNNMNHSSKFWECVESIEPNYKQIRKKLKSYSYILELF